MMIVHSFRFFIIVLLIFSGSVHLKVSAVEPLVPKVIAAYPHDTTSFTQGLVIVGTTLYESCGNYGESKIRKSHLVDGKVIAERRLPAECFAEGIAKWNDQLIQLTWKEKCAFVYLISDLKQQSTLMYEGEGWGLTEYEGALWMSNGSAQLTKRDPKTFTLIQKLPVTLNGSQLAGLNDLVIVDDKIYANVWPKNFLVKIDLKTGIVEAIIDGSALLDHHQQLELNKKTGAVLNGITYRKETSTFLITGKYWPLIFEVVFVPR